MEDFLTYIKLNRNNFDNKNHYWNDSLSMQSKKGKYIYLGEVDFGKAGYKIKANENFDIDTSGSVNKWSILGGIGYKINQKSTITGKIKYAKIDTFVKNNIYETEFNLAYKITF